MRAKVWRASNVGGQGVLASGSESVVPGGADRFPAGPSLLEARRDGKRGLNAIFSRRHRIYYHVILAPGSELLVPVRSDRVPVRPFASDDQRD